MSKPLVQKSDQLSEKIVSYEDYLERYLPQYKRAITIQDLAQLGVELASATIRAFARETPENSVNPDFINKSS